MRSILILMLACLMAGCAGPEVMPVDTDEQFSPWCEELPPLYGDDC